MTFSQGGIQAARFSGGSGGIVYSAAWDGNEYEIYTVDPGEPDPFGTGQKNVGLFGVSRSGELALLPVDPDASARAQIDEHKAPHGRTDPVHVSDTIGRQWSIGVVDAAIGSAGVRAAYSSTRLR